MSEDPVLEGSGVGGDSLGVQVGPVGIPPSDETPQPAGSVAEMPAADGDSAGKEEDGSAGSDEDGWEEGLSNTSQLSDITTSQRGKLYSLKEISDFLERTKGPRQRDVSAYQGFYERFLQKSQMLGTFPISSRGAALRVITLISVFGCWVLCPWDVSASSPSVSDLFSILSSVAGSFAPEMCRHRHPQSAIIFSIHFGCCVLYPWDVSASSPSVSDHLLS
ncbi:UNVERIFIED_CONTAM: hypothetical protein FKN15_024544 [Acipenser sinensis]